MPNAAPRALAKHTYEDLERELRRRRKVASQLEAKRTRLLRKLSSLEAEIRGVGSILTGRAGVARSGSRPKNSQSLTAALGSLLKGKSMTVTEAAAAVQQAGYRTNSNNFRTQVNIALIKGPFKRTGRGVYTAK